ncbi:MAG: hypothetical protein ABI759_31325 [Candidatus Solibacter sp.]
MTDGKIEMLRHALATLGYRASKALGGAPPEFATFGERTPGQILAHMCDLLGWALTIVDGRQAWRNSEVGAWDADVGRFFAALEAFDRRLASGVTLQETPEKLFQGPVADALTHVGQLAMLRRMAGCKIPGENYHVAQIEMGRVGMAQATPVREF